MSQLGDLVISGIGTLNGGTYNSVTISGMGKVDGDVEAGRINISGNGTIKGDTHAGEITISGNGTLAGNVEAKALHTSGNAKCTGQLKADTVDCSGRLRVNGDIKAKKVDSNGYLSTSAGVEAEEFLFDGSFTIDGLLNAHIVNVKIDGFCMAREIGGESIRIELKKQGPGFSQLVLPLYSLFTGRSVEVDKVKAHVIEGTEVTLEHTVAGTVRGSRVKIGAGCRIDRVEYSESYEADPSSNVKESVKV